MQDWIVSTPDSPWYGDLRKEKRDRSGFGDLGRHIVELMAQFITVSGSAGVSGSRETLVRNRRSL